MKLHLILFMTVGFAIQVMAQGWEQVYTNPGGADFGRSVFQTIDGGYVFVGDARSQTLPIFACKTDDQGDTLWTKTFGDPAWQLWELPYSVIQTIDGGYLLGGNNWSYGGFANAGDDFLIKLDASGTLEWEKVYPWDAFGTVRDIIQTNDGGYLFTSYGDYTVGNPTNDYYLTKTNNTGDTLWTKRYFGEGNLSGCSVRETEEGSYLLSGYIDTPGDVAGVYGDTTGVFVAKYDSFGVVIWEHIFSNVISNASPIFNALTECHNGDIIVAGEMLDATVTTKSYVLRLDSVGNQNWLEVFDLQGGQNYATSVLEAADSSIVICGSSYDTGGTIRMYLMKTDSLGNEIWTNYYQDYSLGYQVKETIDLGYVMVGAKNNADWDFYLVKTDMNGGHDDLGLNEQNELHGLEVYPNPTNGQLIVELPVYSPVQSLQLSVIDFTGRAVLMKNMAGNLSEISLGNVAKGVYFVEVRSEEGVWSERIVVQ